MGPLCKQLNKILDKEDISNSEFSEAELNTVNSLRLSKRDLPYLDYFPNLEEIELDLFPSVNDDDIIFIGQKFPNLKSLKIKEQNSLFLLNLSLFNNLEELCIIHNDNLLDIVGLEKVNKFTFYDNKDHENIKQLVDYLLINKDSLVVLDIVYYVNIVNILYEMNEDVSLLKSFTWIESIGLRKYLNYEYNNIEIESLMKHISYIASKYVYSDDSDIMKFCVLYNWVLKNMKFVNEDDPQNENLSLISDVNKVFSYGRGGRLSLAKAFQMLLGFVGIKSSVVYSLGATDVIGMYNGEKVCSLLGESDYAVLRVTLDGKYYYCDIAWDTLINFHGFFDKLRFFLFSKEELKSRHKFVGEGNIINSYSYHGDDCDDLMKKAVDRVKEVDETFDDIERLKPEITGMELNLALLKLNINDIKLELDSLDMNSEAYKKKFLELTDIEEQIDTISNDLIRLENNRDGIVKSYSNLLLDRYLKNDRDKDLNTLNSIIEEKKKLLLISDYIADLLKQCIK